MGSMKVHQLSRGFSSWDHHDSGQPSLSLSCKRFRPLAPKFATSSSSSSGSASSTVLDLKSFIKPDSGPRKPEPAPTDHKRDLPTQVETHPGGTRWNPTQEQIGILEMLYRGGIRTPNAQEIEQITAQLGKYGKIEGKNVFYWFQNHKARERQKQKRNNHGAGLGSQSSPKSTVSTLTAAAATTLCLDNRRDMVEKKFGEEIRCKRTCRSWAFERLEVESNRTACKLADNVTLELFPLHPEGR